MSEEVTDRPGSKIGRPDIAGDRRRLWDVISNGGVAIVPSDLGYGIWGGSPEATRRIIEGKQRGAHKRQGLMTASFVERELHRIDPRQRDMIDCLTQDYDLPIGVIAEYDPDHPLLRDLDPYLKAVGTARGTVATALNAGEPFQEAMGCLSFEHRLPIFASSANLTGRGIKYRIADIEPEVLAIADLVLDYGLCRFHSYLVAATQINFNTMEVLRMGACYDLIADVLKRHFDVDLPPDPGRAANRSGLIDEFALLRD